MSQNHRIIFAIGGGELTDYETLPIDRKIVAAAARQKSGGSDRVRALFIPTASGDESEYCQAFEKVFNRRLGCDTDILYLYANRPTGAEMKRRIDQADLIYVGGGATPDMIKRWHKYDIHKYLRRAWKRGTVMAGLSAGAVCWFRYGLSDAYAGRWTTVACLGFIDLACNVHYSSQKGRKGAFDKLVMKKKITGIGLDDNACIKIVNNKYEIIKSDKDAEAYWICRLNGKIKRIAMARKGEIYRSSPL